MTKALKNVLCIDDDQDILQVAQMCLETVAGFDVTCIDSGIRAVKEAAQINPDIILLDVMMPGMDGPSTLLKLRQIPELEKTPIIFMTARVQDKEVEEYLALGANGVVSKPFDPMLISEQIYSVYDNFHAENNNS